MTCTDKNLTGNANRDIMLRINVIAYDYKKQDKEIAEESLVFVINSSAIKNSKLLGHRPEKRFIRKIINETLEEAKRRLK